MALIGTITTILEQCNKAKFEQALDFLINTNLDEIFNTVTKDTPAEVEIDGRNIFAIFQTYETKDIDDAKMEGHRNYIDIQYMHKGVEQILVSPISRMVKEGDYDEAKDLHFSKVADYSNFRLTSGMACILYPDDLHAPCVSIDAPTKVEKIVIKVAI